jgi:hypothetical protein
VRYLFDAEPWQWKARADSWIFVSLPRDATEEIRDIVGDLAAGFGSVEVSARIGGTRWSTSIFPDSESGCFVLPLKRAVRVAEGVELGEPVAVEVELVL